MSEIIIPPQGEKTEEIQAIIDKMPTSFGSKITMLIILFILLMAVFGWTIKYPDIISGQVVINTNNAPIKLVANVSGKLHINGYHSKDNVKEGDYIAVIQNPARAADMQQIKRILPTFNINTLHVENDLIKYPRNVSLGELNEKYFVFINAYEQYLNYYKENLLSKQEEILGDLLREQRTVLTVSHERLAISSENIQLTRKFYNRDSLLYTDKVIAESELDRSKINFLTVKDAYSSLVNDVTTVREQIQETSNKLQQVAIQKSEKEQQIKLDLMAAYSNLADGLKAWEDKYVFVAPINGKVEFLNFWNDEHSILQGDAIFTIVPERNKMVGQMTLPAFGAGKVKTGQEVIIKLDNYPYMEYGSIKGQISSISMTSNPLKTQSGDVAMYRVLVDLPEELKTNYGSRLEFGFEIKGTGEIITKNRRLVERMFDNLKYIQTQK